MRSDDVTAVDQAATAVLVRNQVRLGPTRCGTLDWPGSAMVPNLDAAPFALEVGVQLLELGRAGAPPRPQSTQHR